MNGQTKDTIIEEILTEIVEKHPVTATTVKLAEIEDGLWDYLDAMEAYIIKKERKL